jgi:predicted RNA-binding Zn ribbon-like protein
MELADAVADEAFLLDLLDSTPIVDGVQHDELDTARAARSWLRARGFRGSTVEWAAIRDARSTLQAGVRGRESARSLDPVLRGVSYHASASDNGVRWDLDAPAGQVPAVRAVLAWDALRRTRPGRLRACENPECARFLIDRSKPNTARWCSMAGCGNRMKARRHYERARSTPN